MSTAAAIDIDKVRINGERLWADLVGTPITFGCVMLSDDLAQQLYDMAYIGMPVTVLP